MNRNFCKKCFKQKRSQCEEHFGTISEIIFVHTNTLETHITYTGKVCDGVNGKQIVFTVAGCLATEKYYKEAGKRDCSSQSPPG